MQIQVKYLRKQCKCRDSLHRTSAKLQCHKIKVISNYLQDIPFVKKIESFLEMNKWFRSQRTNRKKFIIEGFTSVKSSWMTGTDEVATRKSLKDFCWI